MVQILPRLGADICPICPTVSVSSATEIALLIGISQSFLRKEQAILWNSLRQPDKSDKSARSATSARKNAGRRAHSCAALSASTLGAGVVLAVCVILAVCITCKRRRRIRLALRESAAGAWEHTLGIKFSIFFRINTVKACCRGDVHRG